MNAQIRKTTERDGPTPHSFSDVGIILPAAFQLESGETLSKPELRVRIYGDPARPAVAVSGGISSGRAVADEGEGADGAPRGAKGWWRGMVYPGGAIDLDRFCVVAFDFLPNPEEIARTISTLDQARALAHALDVLKIARLHGFIGAS